MSLYGFFGIHQVKSTSGTEFGLGATITIGGNSACSGFTKPKSPSATGSAGVGSPKMGVGCTGGFFPFIRVGFTSISARA